MISPSEYTKLCHFLICSRPASPLEPHKTNASDFVPAPPALLGKYTELLFFLVFSALASATLRVSGQD
jgi:hypothetical protein